MQVYRLCDGEEVDDGRDQRRKFLEKELKSFWHKTEQLRSGQAGY
jgi:hypothetical protein